MTVRAKMRCGAVMPQSDGGVTVHMNAVYSADPASENKAFTDATPNAYMQLSIAAGRPAAQQFKTGAEYYVDFTEATAA